MPITPVVGRAYSMKADNNHILHVIVDEIDGDEVVVHSTKSKRVRKMRVKPSLLRREITSESTAQLAAVVNGETPETPETPALRVGEAATFTPEPKSEPAKPAAKRGPLQLPSGVTASRVVLDFVTENASSDIDAGGQGRPFITHTGKLVIHAKWLRDYLAKTIDPSVTVSQAVTMLRDLGYADRSVAVVGAATKNLSVWMIDAPRGTNSIKRLPAPERKSAAKPAAESETKS